MSLHEYHERNNRRSTTRDQGLFKGCSIPEGHCCGDLGIPDPTPHSFRVGVGSRRVRQSAKEGSQRSSGPCGPHVGQRPGGWASDDISSTYPPRLACLPLLRDWGYHLPALASSLSTAIGAWSHPQAHVKRPSQIFLPAQQCLFAHQTPLLARQTVGSADSTSNVFQPRASLVVRGRKACRAFKQGRPQGTKNMKQTYVIRAASRWQSYY